MEPLGENRDENSNSKDVVSGNTEFEEDEYEGEAAEDIMKCMGLAGALKK